MSTEIGPPAPGDGHSRSFSVDEKGPVRAVSLVALCESQMKVARQARRNMTKRDRKKRMGTGPDSARESGATQQISNTPIADSESVEELAEEGNAFEANAIYGVDDARDPNVSEVITREVPEDDIADHALVLSATYRSLGVQ